MSSYIKHHYVPQCHLRGFEDQPGSGYLFELDKESGTSRRVCTADAAYKKHFYRIEIDDEDPQAIEHFFGDVESRGSEALRHLTSKGTLPDGKLYERLITFLAIASVRVPAAINSFAGPAAKVIMSLLWYAVDNPATFAKYMELRSDGYEHLEGLSYEQARAKVRSPDFNIEMPQNFKMGFLMEMLGPMERLLGMRKWTLAVADQQAPDFICSDRPMTLCSIQPMLGQFSLAPGMKNTMAMFPVNRRMALLGTFEDMEIPKILEPFRVAAINAFTASYAERFIYSGEEDFSIRLASGLIVGRDGFIASLNRFSTASPPRFPSAPARSASQAPSAPPSG